MKIIETNLQFRHALSSRAATRRIIIHHAASARPDISIAEIHQMHLNRKTKSGQPWAGCGYHFHIRHDGRIEQGRPIATIGAHIENANSDSIGICCAGNFEVHPPSEIQLKSLAWLVGEHLWGLYGEIPVKRHGDVYPSACPGRMFLWQMFRQMLIPPLPTVQGRARLIVRGQVLGADALIVNGRVYVPVRAMGEALDLPVRWQDGTAYVG